MFDVIVIGGGAAGFYAAIHIAEENPKLKVAILERGKDVLTKVKVSGGGRCNVTHAAFVPQELVKNYPRGEKEMLGPFHKHCCGDTVDFFEKKGVPLKIEEDGRIFPITDSSKTIIDCFLEETDKLGVKILKGSSVINIFKASGPNEREETGWQVQTIKTTYQAKKVVVASGSNPKIWDLLKGMGHTIIPPVPSLFTFNIKDKRIAGIPGLSTNAFVEVIPAQKKINSKITVKLKSVLSEQKLSAEGPLLITHWGMSGPAVLKLSAWGAKILNDYGYRFRIRVNWLPDYHKEAVLQILMEVKDVEAKKTVHRTKAVDIPKRLWLNLVRACHISEKTKWAEITKQELQDLTDQLTNSVFLVDGKSTFKEEFVTAGGVDLKEINFKTFESKIVKDLFFAGEVIDVDAITGGFNFQNAWTSAYIAAKAIVKNGK